MHFRREAYKHFPANQHKTPSRLSPSGHYVRVCSIKGGNMKKTIAYLTITAALAVAPVTFTGCSIMQGRESAGAYTNDKKVAASIKTQLYKDSVVKGTQVDVNV